MAKLYLLNKPYGVLSQFRDGENRPTLARYLKVPDIYPAGRLDQDSEGLLLLTGDGQLQHRIAHPDHKLPKTYWVQVEGIPDKQALDTLRRGVALKDGITRPAKARLIEPPSIWERTPPIRARDTIPTQWLELQISEGKNRQVRRMTAAVGFPTLRLVRVKIGDWSLDNLAPGEFRLEEVHLPQGPTSPKNRRNSNADTRRKRHPQARKSGTRRPDTKR